VNAALAAPSTTNGICAVVIAFAPSDRERFARVLEAVSAQVGHVIVADNGGGAGLEGIAWGARLERLDMGGNTGVAAAQNAGIRCAFERGASHVLMLDQDSVPHPGMAKALLEAERCLVAAGERVAAVGANYEDPRRPGVSPFVRIDGWRLVRVSNRELGTVVRASYLISSGCLIGAAAFAAVGPMNEALFVDGIDIEWGLRAGTFGWHSFGVCDARLDHRLGEEPLRVLGRCLPAHSPARHYTIVRNAVWMMAHRPLPAGWKVAEALRTTARGIAFGLFSSQRVAHLQAIARGLVDGLRGRLGPDPRGAPSAWPPAATRGQADRPIAVVTVCRNPGPALREALASVRALADSRVRHIVIDGASTDGSVEYLAGIGATLHHWRSEPDTGIYDAMNKGWSAAPADAWVIYIGADDRLLCIPSPAELRAAEAAGHRIVYGTTLRGTTPFRSRLDSTIRVRNTLHHQSLLIAKPVSPAPPFDPRYAVCGDWDFNIRLWKRGLTALRLESLQAYAAPDGRSARRPLKESFRVAARASGAWAGAIAWLLALRGRIVQARLPTAAPTLSMEPIDGVHG
jgi:rhamnosyltransferase